MPYPNQFGPGCWGGHPLSSADPDQFRSYFETILAKLEKEGITLAGFELGNELNSGCFNADFPLSPPPPGQATLFGLDDLYHNPSAQPVIKGYRQYLKVLSVLKDVRDHSQLNQKTPIISFGLVTAEAPPGPAPHNKLNAVSASATIEYMRAGGLDKLVDDYGLHTYPVGDAPGNPEAAKGRRDRLAQYVFMQCHSEGSPHGKPGWVTEWGFENKDTSCPPDETKQVALVREMMDDFREYAAKKKLMALFYYTWAEDNGDHCGVYRCNELTETGRSALQPLTF